MLLVLNFNTVSSINHTLSDNVNVFKVIYQHLITTFILNLIIYFSHIIYINILIYSFVVYGCIKYDVIPMFMI